MTNQADYSKEKSTKYEGKAVVQAETFRKLDIRYENVVIPYRGNDTWVGLKGKKLFGEASATEYAKRLNGLMSKMASKS
jgi:hypothetical protein